MSRSSFEGFFAKTVVKRIIEDPALLEQASNVDQAVGIITGDFFEGRLTSKDLEPLISHASQYPNIHRLVQKLAEVGLCELPPALSRSKASASLLELIYRGELSESLDTDKLLSTPDVFGFIRRLFSENLPFSQDEKLQVLVNQIHDNLSNPVDLKKLSEDIVYLRKYLDLLQTTMVYHSVQKYEESRHDHMNTALITSTRTQLRYLEPFNRYPEKIDRAISELHAEGIDAFENVRGDGSCYYRVILRGYLEHAILHPEDRGVMFSHLAKMYEHELLKPDSCFNRDFGRDSPERQHLMALITKLEAAAYGEAWTSLQEFERDLDDDSQAGADYALMLATRYLTAQCVMDHQDIIVGGLPLREAILPSYEEEGILNMDNFRKQYITKMGVGRRKNSASGVDAEGVWVQAGILPHMLGLEPDLYIVKLNPAASASVMSKMQKTEIDLQGLGRVYHTAALPHPQIKIILFPGHYQLGLNSKDIAQRYEAKRSVVDVPHFTYAEVPEVDVPMEPDLDLLSQTEDKILKHWLDAILMAAIGADVSKLTRHQQRVIEMLTEFMMDHEEARAKIKEFFLDHASELSSISLLKSKLTQHLQGLGLGQLEIKNEKTPKAEKVAGRFKAAVGKMKDDEPPPHNVPSRGTGS